MNLLQRIAALVPARPRFGAMIGGIEAGALGHRVLIRDGTAYPAVRPTINALV